MAPPLQSAAAGGLHSWSDRRCSSSSGVFKWCEVACPVRKPLPAFPGHALTYWATADQLLGPFCPTYPISWALGPEPLRRTWNRQPYNAESAFRLANLARHGLSTPRVLFCLGRQLRDG